MLDYVQHVARKQGFDKVVELGKRLDNAAFDSSRGVWTLTFSIVKTELHDGFGNVLPKQGGKGVRVLVPTGETEHVEAEWLIRGTGFVNKPVIPTIPGIDSFKGRQMHSARWDTSWDYTKPIHAESDTSNILIIGTGSSCVQILPALAALPHNKITVMQRSPASVIPRGGNPVYSPEKRELLAKDPEALEVVRQKLLAGFEGSLEKAFQKDSWTQWIVSNISGWYLWWNVKDRETYQKLKADWPFACKRPCPTDDYIPCFNKPNVKLVCGSVVKVDANSAELPDGKTIPVDVIIFATGYDVSYLTPWSQTGLDGITFAANWNNGADLKHYRSVMTNTQPNFYSIWNANAPVYAVPYGVDVQAIYLVRLLDKLVSDALVRGLKHSFPYIHPRQDKQAAYMRWLAEAFKSTVFVAGCTSWFNQRDPTRVPTGPFPKTFKFYKAELEKETDWTGEYEIGIPSSGREKL